MGGFCILVTCVQLGIVTIFHVAWFLLLSYHRAELITPNRPAMIKKHIAHLATESLKFFFNIDHSICHHWMLTMFLLFGIARIFLRNIIDLFHDGILTVRYDLYTLKTKVAELKEQFEKSEQLENSVKRINDLIGQMRLVRS